MLPELAELEAAVEAMYAQADRVPARTRYLRLSHTYARKLVHLHREWIADIEAELTPAPNPPRPITPGPDAVRAGPN